ncbi:MAG: 3-deoxy-manno-octulosonate cytidylyltransferase [Planctomycetes bacterium]|nr:3-deoxy-manno-octulosonate cytidylyltransferase [Planctomycetota bacterium]
MSQAPTTNSGSRPERRAVAVLPARIGSTRLARKMLLEAAGAPLIVHSARNVIASKTCARVVVAADDDEILGAVRAHGVEGAKTRADHQSGSDRVNECFATLAAAGETAEIVVNVQGDEPELAHADLQALIAAFDDSTVEMATLAVPLTDPAQFSSPNVVKVVCDARGNALYFSRAPIPARAHGSAAHSLLARRHIGVYAFRPAALTRFCTLARGTLEQTESLEQLRWLEHGFQLRVIAASRAPQSIDTLGDWEAFVARIESGRRDEDSASGSVRGARSQSGTGAG